MREDGGMQKGASTGSTGEAGAEQVAAEGAERRQAQQQQQGQGQQGERPMTQREMEEAVRKSMEQVKHKIMVMSGKGGVGKTTVAVNLAFALGMQGFSVSHAFPLSLAALCHDFALRIHLLLLNYI